MFNYASPRMSKPGPGYASPLEAIKGPREEILYVACVQPDCTEGKSDYLGTVDVNPESSTYCQIIHRLYTGNANDELHHVGWNTCSSCYNLEGCSNIPERNKLILPAIVSDRVYIVSTAKNPRAPEMLKVIENAEIAKLNCVSLHSPHCLPNGDIMISTLGDIDRNAKGDFVLIDSNTLEVKGTWIRGEAPIFGDSFWYQPHHDVLVSTGFSQLKDLKSGYLPKQLNNQKVYGQSLNFFSWTTRQHIQTLDLEEDGIGPLDIKFLHDPKQDQGFVGCALGSTVFRFFLKPDGKWDAEKVISVPPKHVEGWDADYMPGFVADMVVSLDDKYLYLSNWWHGDVRQYDISDPRHPKLTGQIFLGGLIENDSKIKVIDDPELTSQPNPVFIKENRLYGGPQMMELSLDGKRLYISSSIFSLWDHKYYPESVTHGSFLVKLDIDVENGTMTLDKNFWVDFKEGPDGPTLAHQMRYPGGDCSSDIWLAND